MSTASPSATTGPRPLAVVTGASRGLGLERANVFARHGIGLEQATEFARHGFDLVVAAESGIVEAGPRFSASFSAPGSAPGSAR